MTIDIIDKEKAAAGGLQEPIANSKTKFWIYYYEIVGSSTALAIKAYLVEKQAGKVGVLLIDANFDSMHIPPHVCADVPALAEFTAGIAVLNVKNPMKIEGNALPLGVSLMHELGHAKQYIENPQWYTNKSKEAMRGDEFSKVAQLEIENDNITRHERPICEELGKPSRAKYD